MIPKIIHYCWFGRNPLPKSAIKCIDSWKRFFPGYEIKEWNEDNFDVNMIPYTAEAYRARKYAFVSDYARFWILYHYGGIYFDTDVEAIRTMDDILAKGAFMGCEKDSDGKSYPTVAPGLGMAVEPLNPLIKSMLAVYEESFFENDKNDHPKQDQGFYKTVVDYATDLLKQYGLQPTTGIQSVAGFLIYPKEYFNPLSHINQLEVTENTRSIHHYAATWVPKRYQLIRKIVIFLGPDIYRFYLKLRGSSRK